MTKYQNKPDPILHPGTLAPATAADLEAVFCKKPVKQELDETTPLISIPGDSGSFTGPTFWRRPGSKPKMPS